MTDNIYFLCSNEIPVIVTVSYFSLIIGSNEKHEFGENNLLLIFLFVIKIKVWRIKNMNRYLNDKYQDIMLIYGAILLINCVEM